MEVVSPMTDSLSTVFVEFIDGVRLVAEMETDKDSPLLNDIRVHFSRFIHRLVSNTPGTCYTHLHYTPSHYTSMLHTCTVYTCTHTHTLHTPLHYTSTLHTCTVCTCTLHTCTFTAVKPHDNRYCEIDFSVLTLLVG